MKKSNMKMFLIKIFPVIFYLLLFLFLYLYLQSIDLSLIATASIHWGYLLIASILALSFRYWGAYIWTIMLRSLGSKNTTFNTSLIYVYAKSWLGRYIPGTAPWILSKIYFASQQGISKNKLAVSSLLEGALQIIVQMIFALALLLLDPRLDVINENIKVLIVIFVAACTISLIPPVFNRVIAIAYKVVKKKTFPAEHQASSKTIGIGLGLYSFGAVMSSLSLFFVAKAVYPELGFDQMLFVMGVGTLAGAVSMLAFFAPGGVGVREAIQLGLLSIIMPVEFALIITVFTRLWSIAIDLIFYSISKTASVYHKHRSGQ